ncbi:MAG: serine/threonine-protein kinase [Anaerolineae bacterium]|nr:serine/threonine-protein kinase [Anaerolineae bacterium]
MSLDTDYLLQQRYRIKKIIAHGGMGSVYQAQDISLNILVAVKENLIETENSSRQFHREATMLAGLRHENLPRVTDHFVIPGQGEYLVMDYIEGKDLREIIEERSPLPLDEVIKIGVAICDALNYLPQRTPPIIPRDIKPGNIKISPGGHIYLVDFGLAKINFDGQTTTTGAKSLTPGYAPPEQYGSGTDARSDIYALGATLYAALSKNVPEDGIARLMGAVELTPLAKLRPDLPAYLVAAIEKAIQIKKEDRFQNIQEFKAALLNQAFIPSENLINHHVSVTGTQAPFTSPEIEAEFTVQAQNTRQVNHSARKPAFPLAAVITGLVLIVIAAAVVLFFVFNSPQSSNQPSTGTPVPVNETNNTPVTTEAPPATLAAALPESPQTTNPVAVTSPTAFNQAEAEISSTPVGGGKGQIAFTSEESGKAQIWLMNSDGSAIKQISNLPDGACQADWSPDGSKLVVTSPCSGRKETYNGSGLFIINADGGGLTPLPSLPGGDYTPRWSPDGARIAFTSIRGGMANVYVINLADRKVVKISRNNLLEQNPAWSPDGKWLAIESTRLNQRQVWLVNPDDPTQAKEFSDINSAAYTPCWSPDGNVILFSQGSSLPWLAARQVEDKAAPEVRLSDRRPALHPRYSPDGYWIVFESKQDNTLSDIYLMNNNGGQITRLTQNQSPSYDPVWRP